MHQLMKRNADLKMTCHKHAVTDIDMQMEVLVAEIELEKGEEVPYNEDKINALYERRIKLINAKRYHTNASNAYWYSMQ